MISPDVIEQQLRDDEAAEAWDPDQDDLAGPYHVDDDYLALIERGTI